ncbi:MAG TPA: ABC transporter ATP-binding protein [Crocinitomix sp.]|nr:ABC transporter ATP-binding protein [Crocinitomix sp.]
MFKNHFSDIKIFKRLLKYLKPYRSYLILALLFTFLISIFSSVRPVVIMEMINTFISGDNVKTTGLGRFISQFFLTLGGNYTIYTQLIIWMSFILLMLIFEALFQFCVAYFGAIMGQSVIKDVREKVFSHIQSFNLKYFDTTPNGTVVTRLISDIEAIADVFSMGLISILGDILKLTLIIGLMVYTNWLVALLILLPVPLLLVATKLFAKAMKKSFEKERLQVNKLNTFVQEHISGMSIVQIFNKQNVEFDKFKVLNKGHRDAMLQAVWATSLFFPIVELFMALSISLLVFWSFMQLDYHPEIAESLAGMIFGYILWVNMLYRPIRQIADRFNVLQRGVVRAERVFQLLDTDESIEQTGQITQVDFDQKLCFNNVWFAYKNNDWVLKGITLKVDKSQTVAIVGATGAGKSTIINLLLRFYEFQKGDITIGDVSIRDIEIKTLRRNIAVVLQDVFLFSDTIFNNITMGDESITLEEVIEASKRVGAHDFISKLPDEYNFHVKERGGILSVGQKQLISFIRAYVYNPKILILDEATASVDSESEELIQKATIELQKGRTSIVIAHRLSTIVNSDKIIVLDNGQIIEEGNHQTLISLNGQYKKLYDLNFV